MKLRQLAVVAAIVGLGVLLSAPARAQCTEGNEPVVLLLPSGQEKQICVPAGAVAGLENAADNANGVLIASACPCFTEEDLQAAAADPAGLGCVKRQDGVVQCGAGEPDPRRACDPVLVELCAEGVTRPAAFVADSEFGICRSKFTLTDTYSVDELGTLTFPVQNCDPSYACVEVSAAEAAVCLQLLEAIVDVDCTAAP